MKRYFTAVAVTFILVASGSAFAEQKTVTLDLQNMTCPSCAYMIKSSLKKVQGVSKAEVSYGKRRAVVTYDDAKTTGNALIEATKNAGFPSKIIMKGKQDEI
jgi:mercuric ion binding protein